MCKLAEIRNPPKNPLQHFGDKMTKEVYAQPSASEKDQVARKMEEWVKNGKLTRFSESFKNKITAFVKRLWANQNSSRLAASNQR